MIEINLLPGSRKARRAAGGVDISAKLKQVAGGIKDPYLAGAIAAVALCLLSVGGLWGFQSMRASRLVAQEQQAVADSTRFAAVLKARSKAQAQRDSVMRQLGIIRAIDNNRYVWSHILDEVSAALPPYTWLTRIEQTSAMPAPPSSITAPKGDSAKTARPDEVPVDTVRFRLVGNTVDIQALTRFMRLLEASLFIQGVQLTNSTAVVEDDKELTQFTLEAMYEIPDSTAIRTEPVSVSVR